MSVSPWMTDVSVLSQALSSMEILFLQGTSFNDPKMNYLSSIANIFFSTNPLYDSRFSMANKFSFDTLCKEKQLMDIEQANLRTPHSVICESYGVAPFVERLNNQKENRSKYKISNSIEGVPITFLLSQKSLNNLESNIHSYRETQKKDIENYIRLDKNISHSLKSKLQNQLLQIKGAELQSRLRITLDSEMSSLLEQPNTTFSPFMEIFLEDRCTESSDYFQSPRLLEWYAEEHRKGMREVVGSMGEYMEELKEDEGKKRKLLKGLKDHFANSNKLQPVEEKLEEAGRLQALKEENMEKYMEFVKKAKNTRLLQILSETEKFLGQVCVRVQEQRAIVTEEEKKEEREKIREKEMEMKKKEEEDNKVKLNEEEKRTKEGNILSEEEKESKERRLMHLNDNYERECEAKRLLGLEGGIEKEDSNISKDGKESQDSSSKVSGLKSLLDSQNYYYTLAHATSEEVTKQSSLLEGGRLKEYQLKGVEWLVSLYNNNINGILADEMGLGKTVQTIALFCHLMEHKHNVGPHLVVVPLSTISNWEEEFRRWSPKVRCMSYKGGKEMRRWLWGNGIRQLQFDVLVTTYELVMLDRSRLSRIRWNYIVVDEGHRMKNAHSKFVLSLSTFKSKHRLLLTGTPLQNNLPELWSLLNFLLPAIFNSVTSFEEWFSSPFGRYGGSGEAEALSEEEQLLIIHRLHQVLRPFLLRRQKKDVEKELPPKVERIIYCGMSVIQQIMYKQTQEEGAFVYERKRGGWKGGGKGLSNAVMQLRKVANHPYLFFPGIVEESDVKSREKGTDTVFGAGYEEDKESIWRCSGKFEILQRILPKLKISGHRILLFSQFTHVMDILEAFFKGEGYSYLRLDGKTKERKELIDRFNNEDIFLFLLSTRSGGQGLNLQKADTVILFDSDWNPFMDIQATDRAHRIGQNKEVRVLRLLSVAPVESRIYQRSREKLDVERKLIQAGKFSTTASEEERKRALLDIIMEEANADEQDEDDDNDEGEKGEKKGEKKKLPSNKELNSIVARSSEEEELFEKIDEENEKEWSKRWSDFKENGMDNKEKEKELIVNKDRLYKRMEDVPTWLRNLVEEEVEMARKMREGEGEWDEGTIRREHGLRERKEVYYYDNMSERDFIRLCEKAEGGDNLKKKKKEKKKEEKEVANYDDNEQNENSETDNISPSSSPPLSLDAKNTENNEEEKEIEKEDEEKQVEILNADDEKEEEELPPSVFEALERGKKKIEKKKKNNKGEGEFKEKLLRKFTPEKKKNNKNKKLTESTLDYLRKIKQEEELSEKQINDLDYVYYVDNSSTEEYSKEEKERKTGRKKKSSTKDESDYIEEESS